MTTELLSSIHSKFQDVDPDLRYMALADLNKLLATKPQLQKQAFSNIQKLLLLALHDIDSEVVAQSIPCFGSFVECDPMGTPDLINELAKQLMQAKRDESDFNNSPECMALKQCLLFCDHITVTVWDALLSEINIDSLELLSVVESRFPVDGYCCVLYEKVLSFIFSRPSSIALKSAIKVVTQVLPFVSDFQWIWDSLQGKNDPELVLSLHLEFLRKKHHMYEPFQEQLFQLCEQVLQLEKMQELVHEGYFEEDADSAEYFKLAKVRELAMLVIYELDSPCSDVVQFFVKWNQLDENFTSVDDDFPEYSDDEYQDDIDEEMQSEDLIKFNKLRVVAVRKMIKSKTVDPAIVRLLYANESEVLSVTILQLLQVTGQQVDTELLLKNLQIAIDKKPYAKSVVIEYHKLLMTTDVSPHEMIDIVSKDKQCAKMDKIQVWFKYRDYIKSHPVYESIISDVAECFKAPLAAQIATQLLDDPPVYQMVLQALQTNDTQLKKNALQVLSQGSLIDSSVIKCIQTMPQQALPAICKILAHKPDFDAQLLADTCCQNICSDSLQVLLILVNFYTVNVNQELLLPKLLNWLDNLPQLQTYNDLITLFIIVSFTQLDAKTILQPILQNADTFDMVLKHQFTFDESFDVLCSSNQLPSTHLHNHNVFEQAIFRLMTKNSLHELYEWLEQQQHSTLQYKLLAWVSLLGDMQDKMAAMVDTFYHSPNGAVIVACNQIVRFVDIEALSLHRYCMVLDSVSEYNDVISESISWLLMHTDFPEFAKFFQTSQHQQVLARGLQLYLEHIKYSTKVLPAMEVLPVLFQAFSDFAIGDTKLTTLNICADIACQFVTRDPQLAQWVDDQLHETSSDGIYYLSIGSVKNCQDSVPLSIIEKCLKRQNVEVLVLTLNTVRTLHVQLDIHEITAHIPVNKGFTRVIKMGPYKHTIDDGIEVRKAAYSVLLNTPVTSAQAREITELCIKGLKDSDNQVVILASQLIVKLVAEHKIRDPELVASFFDRCDKVLKRSYKENATKQEIEKIDTVKTTINGLLQEIREMWGEPGNVEQ